MTNHSDIAPPGQDPEGVYQQLLENLVASTADVTVTRLGQLIDLSEDLGRTAGLERAIETGHELVGEDTSPSLRALVHYFISNAWEARRRLSRSGWDLHSWEQAELEHQIIHLRHAVALGTTAELGKHRLCQIHTNLGNLLSHCGRTVDAIEAWDMALSIKPDFGMALGNRGYGLTHYARLQHDPGHRAFHLREAFASLSRALGSNDLHPEARSSFEQTMWGLTGGVPVKAYFGEPHAHDFRGGIGAAELSYRTWCLNGRLFLNDLNDLGNDPIAAADVLTLPSITTSIVAPQPSAFGFFNQLKQEYVSARYFYYRGTTADGPHFSDRNAVMINTLDYPTYGFLAEQVRAAFRLAYSLFDKIAYFLNDYLDLSIPEHHVSFRGLWYVKQDPRRGLRDDLHRAENTPLKGLFWTAKDLYDRDPRYTAAIEPDAQELASIRNHLEHKYLKLHEYDVAANDPAFANRRDALAYSLSRDSFERKTLALLKRARAALLLLASTVYVEEHRRSGEAPKDRVVAPSFMDTWEDEWKF